MTAPVTSDDIAFDLQAGGKPCKFLLRAAVILKLGKLTLVESLGQNALCLPGGKVQAGEQPLDALRRELQEELNLSPGQYSEPKLAHVWNNVFQSDDGHSLFHEVTFCFLAFLNDYARGFSCHDGFRLIEDSALIDGSNSPALLPVVARKLLAIAPCRVGELVVSKVRASKFINVSPDYVTAMAEPSRKCPLPCFSRGKYPKFQICDLEKSRRLKHGFPLMTFIEPL